MNPIPQSGVQEIALMRLVQDAAGIAGIAPTAKDALRACLARITMAGFAFAQALVPADGGVLVASGLTHSEDPPRFAAFRDATAAARFLPGIGMLGRVMTTRRAASIADAQRDSLRGTAARASGVHACVAFPVTVGPDVVAVIEVCSDRIETPSEALTLALETVGAILGRAFERERHAHDVAEQALVDPLTGLASRRAFLLLAAQQIKIAARMQRTPTLLALELAPVAPEDADEAIKDAASLIRGGFRDSDLIGRIGERTFAVFAVDTSPNQADALRERIRRNVDSFNQIRRRRYTVSLTTGVTVFDPQRPQKIEHGLEHALSELRPLGGPHSVRRSA